jgi:hypothetical protein
MQLLTQKDARWEGLKINGTQYTMAGYGCFITCVSMVADILPTEALKKLTFDGAMLNWESIKNIGLEPLYKGDWDNAKALQFVADNGQCITRVDFDGSDRTDDTHFVVLIGNKRLYDPWTGTERPTSSYTKYTGIRACKKVTMNADEIAVKKTDFENLVKKSTQLDEILTKYGVPDPQGVFSMVQGKDSRITDLTNQLGVCQANDKNKEEVNSRLQDELLNKQNDINTLTDRIDQCTNTTAQLGKDKGNLAIEVEQLKIQVDTLKQQAVQGGVTLSIKDFFSMLWNGKITLGGK